MSEALYERYKDALRRGTAASLRGRFDEAIAAYAEAASIAPDRAMPQASLAGVLARTGRISEALAAYEVALSGSPRTRRRCAAGRRCLPSRDGASTPPRRSIDSRPCSIATGACSRPPMPLVAPWTGRVTRPPRGRGRVRDPPPGGRRRPGVRGAQPGARHARRPRDGRRRRRPHAYRRRHRVVQVRRTEARPSPLGDVGGGRPDRGGGDRLDGGDQDEARRCYLEAAAAQRSIGNLHAAMDSRYQALAVSPAAGDVHLSLTELYLDRGWRTPAADKLVLLGRLVELAGDDLTRPRLCTMAADRFPDDTRLAAFWHLMSDLVATARSEGGRAGARCYTRGRWSS